MSRCSAPRVTTLVRPVAAPLPESINDKIQEATCVLLFPPDIFLQAPTQKRSPLYHELVAVATTSQSRRDPRQGHTRGKG